MGVHANARRRRRAITSVRLLVVCDIIIGSRENVNDFPPLRVRVAYPAR